MLTQNIKAMSEMFNQMMNILIVVVSHARILEESDDLFLACNSYIYFFFNGDQLSHTNATLKARISPQ